MQPASNRVDDFHTLCCGNIHIFTAYLIGKTAEINRFTDYVISPVLHSRNRRNISQEPAQTVIRLRTTGNEFITFLIGEVLMGHQRFQAHLH